MTSSERFEPWTLATVQAQMALKPSPRHSRRNSIRSTDHPCKIRATISRARPGF